MEGNKGAVESGRQENWERLVRYWGIMIPWTQTSKLPTLAQKSAVLQTFKEMCGDNECPDTQHKITLFYCINFAVVVLKGSSARLHVIFKFCALLKQHPNRTRWNWLAQILRSWDSSVCVVLQHNCLQLSVPGLIPLNKQGLNCFLVKYKKGNVRVWD